MKIIKASVEQMTPPIDGMEFLKTIERAGRVCYKSEDKITDESCIAFVRKLIKNGHEAMIEHAPSISMKFICDRGVSHEIVRHRLFSFAQESTRYCNYGGKDIVFILPCWFSGDSQEYLIKKSPFYALTKEHSRYLTSAEELWFSSILGSEEIYNELITCKWSPQEARSVLPNSLKTEIIVTGNLREWRHFFRLRTAKNAHPQMQEVVNMALAMLRAQIPVVFEDIGSEEMRDKINFIDEALRLKIASTDDIRMNEHEQYVKKFAENHGMSLEEAANHPMIKAHLEAMKAFAKDASQSLLNPLA